MFSQEQINSLAKEIMARMNEQSNGGEKKDLQRCKTSMQDQNASNAQAQGTGCSSNKISITPSKALVIAGILGGTLDVNSVLVDKNQEVQIVLIGSLKKECSKPKTELEMMMEKIGSLPFDQVMKTMLERLT